MRVAAAAGLPTAFFFTTVHTCDNMYAEQMYVDVSVCVIAGVVELCAFLCRCVVRVPYGLFALMPWVVDVAAGRGILELLL